MMKKIVYFILLWFINMSNIYSYLFRNVINY